MDEWRDMIASSTDSTRGKVQCAEFSEERWSKTVFHLVFHHSTSS